MARHAGRTRHDQHGVDPAGSHAVDTTHGSGGQHAAPVADHDHDHTTAVPRARHHETTESAARGEDAARDRFGGLNWGASFFGWLVAIGVTILLTGIVSAVLAAVGSTVSVTQSEAERQAGTIGITAAAAVLVVLLIGYFTGGYVAGRMSRFDGGRQGLGVWAIGFAVTIIAGVVGAAFGSDYNVLDRVDLPRIPIPFEQVGWGAAITAAAVILGTLLAAMLGGKIGHRYHDKVDRIAGR